MVQSNKSETLQLIRDYRTEAAAYSRQWANWVGIASGSGAVALLSFAANLPNPDFALAVLLPALAAFVSGVCFAGVGVAVASLRVSALGEHHVSALNREVLEQSLRTTAEMISSPAILAERHNAPRNSLIGKHDSEHKRAEVAWTYHVRWKWTQRICLLLAAMSFLLGTVLPLIVIWQGGSFVASK